MKSTNRRIFPFPGSSTRCRVINLFPEAAVIDVPNPSFVPQLFQLMTENDSLTVESSGQCKTGSVSLSIGFVR
jgi:hypothetical protein